MPGFRKAVTTLLVVLALTIGSAALSGCGAAGATKQSEETATAVSSEFTLSSPAVEDGRLLSEYKCEKKTNGAEDSIPLAWANVPSSAKSLAVIMYHYPDPNDLTKVNSYLLLWGIDPSVTEIPFGQADKGDWFLGSNKDGTAVSYTSPCSKGAGTHEYVITVYALSEMPSSLPTYSTKDVTYEVLKKAIETVAVVGTATLKFVNVTP
jgi:phosphatidylethanolamine-binding protein (PEBP) family uncharacterized protein